MVPTADLNTTFGLSITVFLLIQVFGDQGTRAAGLHQGVVHRAVPCRRHRGKILLAPANLLLRLIEELVQPAVAWRMRLFGNMYAGELVFMLIA